MTMVSVVTCLSMVRALNDRSVATVSEWRDDDETDSALRAQHEARSMAVSIAVAAFISFSFLTEKGGLSNLPLIPKSTINPTKKL
jgi:hypothetical protein